MEEMEEFMQALYSTSLNAGLSIVSRDTAARILSVIGLQGGDERIALSNKCRCDLDFIRQRYHINGGEVPDILVVRLIKRYTKECQNYTKEHDGEWPQWVNDLFFERYGFKPYKL